MSSLDREKDPKINKGGKKTLYSKKKMIHILLGPVIFILCVLLLPDIFPTSGAQAIGIGLWMIFWWITRPVHITVTAFIPVIANAFLNMAEMDPIISQYSSPAIILVLGSQLIIIPWALVGLDKRVALKILSVVGPSMKSQITVWLLASILLSTVLPNVAVTALFCPIAISMLAAAGYHHIPSAEPAVPILLSIAFGVSLGGAGTPLGGAMNQAAISALEEFTGNEFMYVDWIIRVTPYLIIASLVLLACMLALPLKVKKLEGTKDFFKTSYNSLGTINRDEKICASLFIIGLILAFTRPLYADLLPAAAPPYIFLTIGFISFFITTVDKGFLLTWERAQKGTMWGMMILFAGGLALGKLINTSGASTSIGEIFSILPLDGGLITIIALVVFVRAIAEATTGTTAAAIMAPIILQLTTNIGLNPIPYWFITVMAYNEEFLLPVSVRAIPVGYGLDAKRMLKPGIPFTIINMIVIIIFGYLAVKFFPGYGDLPYLFN
ncbi:MAG TPA: SLC13 family permease [Anaerovoracaceae bacterium]|nr:SLC13 family permease [Anaerovoracaceae bacterium]